MSTKVLGRRRQRRMCIVGTTCRVGVILAAVGILASDAWMLRQKTRMDAAPNWANFKAVSSPYTETVIQYCDSGLPCTLIINGEQWSLVRADHFNEAEHYLSGGEFSGTMASTFCENKTIAYIDTPAAAVFRNNLLHEIFHAGACLHGGDAYWNSIDPTRNEHPGVYHLGEFMGTFLHDNPEFAEWMAKP